MTVTRDTLLHVFAVLVLAAGAAWVVHNTEWVEERAPVAPHGEAARDHHYAARQVLRRLGVELVTPLNFDRLPPPGTTLVLASWDWNLFPERDRALRRWVEDGGHLVVSRFHQPDWVPIAEAKPRPPAPGASASAAPPRPRTGPAAPSADCVEWQEPETVAPAFATRRAWRVCGVARISRSLTSPAPAQWALARGDALQVLRVGVGRGTATVSGGVPTDNDAILQHDNALLFVALTQATPGRPVWIVDREERPPLLSVIWHAASPVVLLGAAALALLLWRAGVRFGPRARIAPTARRSVADQIRGTAAFVFGRNAATLHRVQVRALEEAGRRRLRDHDRLDRRARADAIARLTALDADALARAMDTTLTRTRRDLIATLTLLETAVRRLATDR